MNKIVKFAIFFLIPVLFLAVGCGRANESEESFESTDLSNQAPPSLIANFNDFAIGSELAGLRVVAIGPSTESPADLVSKDNFSINFEGELSLSGTYYTSYALNRYCLNLDKESLDMMPVVKNYKKISRIICFNEDMNVIQDKGLVGKTGQASVRIKDLSLISYLGDSNKGSSMAYLISVDNVSPKP